MQSLSRNGYTAAQVKAALHAPARTLYFEYHLLDAANNFLKKLGNITQATIRNNALAQIKRAASFTLLDDGTIDFLSNRIKPYALLKMQDGGWARFPLGVFLLTTPPRELGEGGTIWRKVEAYDLLQILFDDKVTYRFIIEPGAKYTDEIRDLLAGAGFTKYNLTPSTKTAPGYHEWQPGTPKLDIINELLEAINYKSLSMDEDGLPVAIPYISPADAAPEYTYQDDGSSVIFPEGEDLLDLWNIPNKFILVVSEADRPTLRSEYTNTNPASPISTARRKRVIVDYRTEETAADQETLDAKAARVAFEASQVYQQVNFETAIMPFHSDGDIIALNYSLLGVAAKYREISWEFELRAGAKMKHEIRRVVAV